MSTSGERLDVTLHRLCLTRTRTEAKRACEAGAVSLDGRAARPSDSVRAGSHLEIRFPHRRLEIRLTVVPARSVSKQAARELYTVLRDDPVRADAW